jgi:hypothetical protein
MVKKQFGFSRNALIINRVTGSSRSLPLGQSRVKSFKDEDGQKVNLGEIVLAHH